MSLTSVALVSLLALLSPLIVRLIRLPVPDIVLQILLGIIVGPQVLGWARVDEPVRVLSLIGLSFLLFLAGLELDFSRLRGRTMRTAASAFVLSFALALVLGSILGAAGLVKSSLRPRSASSSRSSATQARWIPRSDGSWWPEGRSPR